MKRGAKHRQPVVSDIMTVRDVADYLRCNFVTLYRLIKTAVLPAFRLGSDWRFRREDIEKWIAQRHVRPGESLPPGRGRKRKS